MALSTDVRKLTFTGDGATNLWPITYRFFSLNHLVVRITDLLGNVSSLVPGVDFSITGSGLTASASVVLTAGPLATGYTMTVERTVPYVQQTDLVNEGAFYPQTIEDTFDYLMMAIQQLVAGYVYLQDIVLYGWNLIYDLACWAHDAPAASAILGRWAIARTVTFPANLVGSRVSSAVAATGSYVLTVKKNGSSVATLTWAAGGTVPTMASSGFSVASGDIVTVEAPATPDATLAKISITLAGVRSA